MKNNKRKSMKGQTVTLKFFNHAFAGALVAGLISAVPTLAAPPLPTPCAGTCGPATNLPFQAGLPTVSTSTSGTTMTITQTSPTAILNWQNFNINNGYSVNFVQPSSTASALNRIWDANPSTIAGALNANGQIYLINQNGIIFGNGAQVNTGALIASSLDIKDSVYQKGYLANNNTIGVFSAPTFSGTGGFVRVDTGAMLNGSRIMMFAPVVENNGSIATTDGQAVLAAGHNIYLEASQDPNLRGVLVEVDVTAPGTADAKLAGQVQNNAAGTVTNAADIIAQRGNVTLVGFAVNQQGRVSATTSVTQNGSIKLLARHSVNTSTSMANRSVADTSNTYYDIRATQTGVVTLDKNSVTQVIPESRDVSTTTDGQGFNPSIVEVMGKTVNVQGSIIAPGGKVNLVAVGSIDTTMLSGQSGYGIYQEINSQLPYSSFLNPYYKPDPSYSPVANAVARVFLDNGSLIDVSGSTASVSVARNILSVQLRGSQLADAPLQKNGFLWGKTVNIDIRKGSTLANYAGDEAQIGRTVAERTAAGGQVVITSTGDEMMNPGATINISGGQVSYTGDYVNTTTLISKGVAYDIANASPNLIYDAIGGSVSLTHNKWGVTETWNTLAGGDVRGTWDPGYVEGKAAGSVTLLAPNAALQGKMLANTVSGIYQRQPYADPASLALNNYQNTWKMLPKGGSLSIGYGQAVKDGNSGQYNFLTNANVAVQANPQQTNYTLGDVLSSTTPITLSTSLFSSNLNNLAVYTNGIASINSGASLVLAPGGSITLQGGQVDMLGSINAGGGTVSLKTVQTVKPAYNIAGTVTVGGNISTRGNWVNDSAFFGVPDTSSAIVANGGNISLSSGNVLNIASGFTFDASGGGWVDQSGKVHGGNGGSISLAGGVIQAALDQVVFSSYGVDTGKGGSLKLSAGDVQIGGVATNGVQFLPVSFFQTGGFSAYIVTAQGAKGLNVDGLIQPKAKSLMLNRDAAFKASGTGVYAFSNPGFLPDWQRNPVSITLAQTEGTKGKLTIGSAAQILTDPKASITLNAANQLTVLGTLAAPAGSINLNLTSNSSLYSPFQSIWLGSTSQLLAKGYFQQAQSNVQNLVQGQVLSGGKINIATNTGYVVAQSGSLLDVSGASANLDLSQLQSGGLVYRTSHVAGDAGSISVQTGEGALFDGNMNAGVEAGSQAAAGAFSLTLNNDPELSNPSVSPPNPGGYPMVPAQIQVMADGNGSFATRAGLTSGNDANAGKVSLNALAGKALLDAVALQKSGFDQMKLKSDNAIMLADQVNLQARRSITLDTPQLVANGSSTISAAQVTLGNLDQKLQITPNPAGGAGALNISGQLVDLTGNFLVSGVSQFNVASSGDIRLNGIINSTGTALTGSLRTLGNVSLQADQIYPSTMAQFKLSVEDSLGAPAGKITVLPGQHVASPVLSAGGQLTLSAADIVQNGTMKAPLGTLNLNGSHSVTLGSGSLTSVSAEGQTIPFGLIQGGNAWYYDLTGQGNLVAVAAPPQKIVKLGGPNVSVAKGAVIDLAGGGDLYANEFFAGTGGSVNVLDPVKAPANTYAILPGLSGFAPYDPQYAGQYAQAGSKTMLQPGSRVYLSGGTGIPAGYYTLLPASYALLPGAYRVIAVSGYTDRQPGLGATTLLDGTQIIAGKFAVAGTNIQDARWSGFAVSSGAIVRTQSEFHDSNANAFFAAQATSSGSIAPRSPIDAGQLIVNATAALQLAGTVNTQQVTGGKGAWVDLNGPGFDIVNAAGTGTAGLVELTTSVLNNLGAESLLIGGVRMQTSSGSSIAVSANTVVVDNSGAMLTGAEIILAAKNAVTVKAGSSVQGNGTYSGKAQNITLGDAVNSGDGALLRVSSGDQVTVTRNNSSGTLGTLSVENGASVSAQNSVLFDASHVTSLGGSTTLTGKALSVAASAIDIGNDSSSASSLWLTSALLGQMQNFQDITLHSYNDINFYGQATLGGLGAQGNHLISNLALNAMSLNGVNNAGNTASIDAANVTLMNNNTTLVRSAVPNGSGTLKINVDKIVLGEGAKAKAKNIRGFDNVVLNATQQISGQGKGELLLTSANANVHSLVLQGTLTGVAKSDQTIDATGYDTTILAPTVASAANGDIGAKLAITAKGILDKGSIDMAAGSVSLHATGVAATDGITLDTTSRTSASGSMKNLAGQVAYAPAGAITLVSDNGNLEVKSGAVVDVSGATSGGDAGSLTMTAAKGAVTVSGNLKGSAATGYAQGSYILDVASLGGAGNVLTGLNDTLTTGGFTNLRDMRIRTGNLVLDADVPGTARAKAQTFRLAADTGNIDVFGTVDSSGASGGNILLAAKNNLTLNVGALLDAHATGAGQTVGKVALETSAGSIELNNQLIDVHGNGNTGGSVLLHAPRNIANSDVALNNTGGTKLNVSTGTTVTVEAFKTYTSSTGILTAADVAATSIYNTEATAFAANAAAVKTRLGMLADPNLHLTPGAEIDSATNLTLTKDWDLSSWRFNDGNGGVTESGILTLKAVGDINFGTVNATTGVATTASLCDGFTSATSFALLPAGSSSWSYRLVAGADLMGANVLAVNNAATGNVNLAPGGYTPAVYGGRGGRTLMTPAKTSFDMVRTGTGSIDLAAGGGLYLGNSNAMIYTAGQKTQGLPASLAGSATKAFTTNGGDVNIAVKGDINATGQLGTGSAVNQLISDWLWRQGSTSSTNGTYATLPAWWVDFGSFAQNIGALGGGNLNISAGGNITSLSAVVPSTGYVTTPGAAATLLTGGNLSVKAGGNINSGIFYVGNGQGLISAGGALDSSRGNASTNITLNTILALGQGNIDVKTGGDLNLQTVLNPTMIGLGPIFFTYGDNSGVSLASLNGNVLLSNDTGFYAATPALINNLATSPYINPGLAKPGALTVYPGTLNVTALNGSISNNLSSSNTMTLFPSSRGNLQFLAASDINFNGFLTVSDVSTSTLQANTPVSIYSDVVSVGHGVATGSQLPLHSGDTAPIIIAAGGSVTGDNSSPGSPSLTLPKSATIQAGLDIKNLSMSIQNVQSSDTTSLTAGRDIVFSPNSSSPSSTTLGITVAGPGQFVVQAGRNVDLGQSTGLMTNGNLVNPYLPEQGASITVLAGASSNVSGSPAFVGKYIDPASGKGYSPDLISFVNSHGAQAANAADAFAAFNKMPAELQSTFVDQVFFSELRQSGRNAAKKGNYQAGYDAIATLFPAGGCKGDINLYYSQIKTMRGGNINLLTPGGGVNAGLANPSSTGPQKTAAQLGIVTVKGGDVNAFVNNDFMVNQSRVFTLQGGNILMWSSTGNIDAGKGSKSVSSTPPPLLVVDPKTGAFNVDVTQSVVGSGIRVLLANKNVVPGTVDLFAPSGEINAGDAGIGAAGNIFLGALRVVGADNINFGGTSVGVPVAAPAPVNFSGMGNMQDASNAADQATQNMSNASDMAKKSLANFKPTFLSVEVTGLGAESVSLQQ